MTALFQELAQKENGAYRIRYETNYSPKWYGVGMYENGKRISSIILIIAHRGRIIKLKYALADHNFATIQCYLDSGLPELEIKSSSHYSRIFNKKKNILKVHCSNTKFKAYIEESLIQLGIEQIARNNLFEPCVVGKNITGEYSLITTYHLAFEEKQKELEPIINFYKRIIDFSLQHKNEIVANGAKPCGYTSEDDKTEKFYKIFLVNETDKSVKIKDKLTLEPTEEIIFKFSETDSMIFENGPKIHIRDYGLDTQDERGQLAGIGGEFWENYNLTDDVDYGFAIVPPGEGDIIV